MNITDEEIHLVFPGVDLHIGDNTQTIGKLKRIIDGVLLYSPEIELNLEDYQELEEVTEI